MALPIIASVLGSAASSYTNYKIAQDQMKFQERMSNTAYQRGVQDMRKAGLNPALAYQQGGASSPVGAKSEVENPISSAMALARTRAEIANLEQTNAKLQAETDTERGKPYNIAGSLRRNIESDLKKGSEQIATAKELKRANIATPIWKQIQKRQSIFHKIKRYVENAR